MKARIAKARVQEVVGWAAYRDLLLNPQHHVVPPQLHDLCFQLSEEGSEQVNREQLSAVVERREVALVKPMVDDPWFAFGSLRQCRRVSLVISEQLHGGYTRVVVQEWEDLFQRCAKVGVSFDFYKAMDFSKGGEFDHSCDARYDRCDIVWLLEDTIGVQEV